MAAQREALRTPPSWPPSAMISLGRYAFGAHYGWQTQLAKELGVSRQVVVSWLSGARPVSERLSARVAMIARR